MSQSPRFYYFLSDDQHPVYKDHSIWNAAIPLSRKPYPRQRHASVDITITYAEYFSAVEVFLSARSFEPVCKALSSILRRKIDADTLQEIRIYLEKHGEFYHPARIVTCVGETCVTLVLNVALSNVGKEYLKREYHNLKRLREEYLFDFIPIAYEYGCVPIDNNRQIKMFLGEWFEGYHEFHVTGKGDQHPRQIVVWDTEKGIRFLAEAQALLLYQEATAILTAYYNIGTSEHIFSWHHAAGDFVVNLETPQLRVKLVTVRRYERLINGKNDDDLVSMVHALFLFLLKVSIQMRIDRVDGVGEISWIDDFVIKGVLRGFFNGLQLATKTAALPDTFVDVFKAFLKGVPDADVFDLFSAVVSRMGLGKSDQAVVRSQLKNHVKMFLKMKSAMLDQQVR